MLFIYDIIFITQAFNNMCYNLLENFTQITCLAETSEISTKSLIEFILFICAVYKRRGRGGSKCCPILRTVVNDFWESSIFLNLWTFTRTKNKSFFLLNVKISFNFLKFSYGLLHCFLETSLYLTYSFETEVRNAK